MKTITKSTILAIIIYLLNISFTWMNNNPSGEGKDVSDNPLLVFCVLALYLLLQLSFEIVPTWIMTRKFRYTYRMLPLTVIIMYILFAIYEPPAFYLLVYTGEVHWFFDVIPAMPYWQASIFITLQYSIVMLITIAITNAIRKRKANVKNIADLQAEAAVSVEQVSENNNTAN